MGFFTNIANALTGRTQVQQQAITPEQVEVRAELPVNGGRQSVPEWQSVASILEDGTVLLRQTVPTQMLKTIAHLSKYNADISNAVANVTDLGTTPHDLELLGVSDTVAAKTKADLQAAAKTWYGGGPQSLKMDLLRQVAVYGCVSAEFVPDPMLKGVIRIVLVNPENVEFVYDPVTESYLPYQRLGDLFMARNTNSKLQGSLKPLNPKTYLYAAIQRDGDTPYALPPFLSALESVVVEKSMLDNMKNVIHKMGILGFLHTLVTAPKINAGESVPAYQARCQSYLKDRIIPELEKGFAKGFVVGFKDTHEFKLEGNKTDVSGAKDLFELITQMKMSGLKQDPRLLGREFSTTETYGKVILGKFAAQLSTYQMAVDDFLERAFFLHLTLQGVRCEGVTVKSHRPLISDEKAEAETMTVKIANYDQLYQQGVISQEQRSAFLGFPKPDQPTPRTPQATPLSLDWTEAAEELGQSLPLYHYEDAHTKCGCGGEHLESLGVGADLREFFGGYFNEVRKGYQKAVDKATSKIAAEMDKLGQGTTPQQITDLVFYHLYTQWGDSFTKKQRGTINKWVNAIHKFYREDTAFLKGWKKFDPAKPPKAVFGVLDYRTMEYYKNSDELYLGKFITDPDTRAALTDFIKERYVGQNLPIGKGEAALKEFRKEFSSLLYGEDWKISRIIATTVNRMRNTAGALYMEDAGVEKYKLVGVSDRLQCDWCKGLQGKEFTLAKATTAIKDLAASDPANVKSVSKFVTARVTAEEAAASTAEALEAAYGEIIPPLHPNCRDTIIAVL